MRGRGRAKRVARYEMALMECDNAEMPREGEKRVSASIFIHPSLSSVQSPYYHRFQQGLHADLSFPRLSTIERLRSEKNFARDL